MPLFAVDRRSGSRIAKIFLSTFAQPAASRPHELGWLIVFWATVRLDNVHQLQSFLPVGAAVKATVAVAESSPLHQRIVIALHEIALEHANGCDFSVCPYRQTLAELDKP